MAPNEKGKSSTSRLDNVGSTIRPPRLALVKPPAAFITVSLSIPLVDRITDAVNRQKKVQRGVGRPTFSKIVEQCMDWDLVDQLAGKMDPKK